MPSLQCERSALLLCGIVLALANTIYAQGVGREGDEFTLSGRRVGNQKLPHIAIGPAGGYLVWQDNQSDGSGKSFGIAARKLSPEMQPMVPVFRVNQIVDGLQENPQVVMMRNGGAAFVWQGGRLGNQDIYFRTYLPTGVLKPLKEVRVNTYAKGQQSTPVITCLSNGNFAVAWCSLHQDRSLEGVYARIVTPTGTFPGPYSGAPFRVNQFTGSNQRSPAVATLSNGHFVVVWVSENQGVSGFETFLHTNRVHVYGRVFTKGGYPVSNEFRVNTRSNFCARPSVAQWGERGFTVTWAERSDVRTNGWDIYARTFSGFDAPVTDAWLVNETTYGEQFAPKIAQVGRQQLVVWNSLGQDTFREGVFGRFLTDGLANGSEFLVNTLTRGAQIEQTVASDNREQFLVAWSGYMGTSAYDLRGQRYVAPEPPPPGTGSETGGSANTINIAQPPGIFPLAPPSPGTSTGTGSGSTASVLRLSITSSNKGKRLTWNTEPGRVYQVQYSTNTTHWDNLGDPRAATSTFDMIAVGSADSAGFYRVIRVP